MVVPGRHLALALPSWASSHRRPPPPPEKPFEPALVRAMALAEPGDTIRVIVTLHEQSDPYRVAGSASGRGEPPGQLVTALRTLAGRAQAPLLAYLEGARIAGTVESYTPFWIFNGVAVCAQPDVVSALAANPLVASIRLDHYRQWITDAGMEATEQDLEDPVEWGISRVRADQVWNSLHVSGTGSVVAGMDTGVDWLHPALQTNYRGYNPHGPHNHVSSWFDAVGGAVYPIDDHWHGTHTMGTAVGREGVGVAPGSRWIGVKVFNSSGYAYDSWIHSGFQWILAPGEDPGLAPDVVNCSWGSDYGYMTTFQADLQALRAAGILAVFSNGNNGPQPGTVGSPASMPEAFSVGATDKQDQVTNFSSRGPSPWGQIRPHISAPGVDVRSSVPGGLYGSSKGTSMAAPHVTGVAALLRSVSPTLSITRLISVITSTAVPLDDFVPNNDTGWGLVNGLGAVSALANSGFVSGTVSRAGDGLPVIGAAVAAASADGGGSTATASGGKYVLALAAGFYDLTVSSFGYQSSTVANVRVITGDTTSQSFSLVPDPHGTVRGHIADAETTDLISATISVLGTPVEVITSSFALSLPVGTYTFRARSLGYRVVTASIPISAGVVTTVAFALPPSQSILLLDSGSWYYESEAGYYRQALDELAFAYDEWSILSLEDDLPTGTDLAEYDVVVWTAPEDAPGYIGAEDAIVEYLSGGGNLVLSGQDVAFLDGGGIWWFYYPYVNDYLKVNLVRDDSDSRTVEGLPGDLFSGLVMTITGPGGADNQEYADVIAVADEDYAAPVLNYQGGGCGGARVGTCLDYKAVFLSFGFEAINQSETRREVMERTLEWLAAEPPSLGLSLTPPTQNGVGLPGQVVSHAVRVRHLGQSGITDVFTLTLEGGAWDAYLQTNALALAPCMSATVGVTVIVPVTAGWGEQDTATFMARSSVSPTLMMTVSLTTGSLSPIILVDDDRWYDQEARYEGALSASGLSYDYWSTTPGGGPSLSILQHYPIVVWFTGYDWYRPLTADERQALEGYLEGGGRLFLSSQDYLYHHDDTALSKHYLGALRYVESVTPTAVVGVPGDPLGGGLGPWGLDYPFPNWSDAVEPAPGTVVSFRDQHRLGVALSHREDGYASVLFSFPFEALPEDFRPAVMEAVVGWLSWIGDSDVGADPESASPGSLVTHTIRVRNDGPVHVAASISNTIPAGLVIISDSLTGPAAYQPLDSRVSWTGGLDSGDAVTITYQVSISLGLAPGTVLRNQVRYTLEDQNISFRRTATVRVGAADLSPSLYWADPSPVPPGSQVTATLSVLNAGPADSSFSTVSISTPVGATVITAFLSWEGGGMPLPVSEGEESLPGGIGWAGPISAGARLTFTFWLTMPGEVLHPPLYSVAFLNDEWGGSWERHLWLVPRVRRIFMPAVMRTY